MGCDMTGREIRDIQLEKGATFTAEFIKDFDREWTQAVKTVRDSGIDLSMPIVKK